MPRKKVRSFRLFSRLSENNMTDKELDFIKEQINNQTKAKFIRQAVKIYYKYHTGELFEKILDRIEIKENIKIENNKEEYEKLNKVIDSGFFE